jgi:exodeoxyribonuclease V gamma subunit
MAGKGLYRPGYRSRREDDRYLFLEALLSAREKFYISYVGRDVRDNSPRMPSVLVGQLRDYLAAGWTLEGNEDDGSEIPLLNTLTCLHPLQPFGSAYFFKGQTKHFTYAHEWRSSLDVKARTSIEEALEPFKFEGALNLTSLIRFVKNPVKYFFNQRLSINFDEMSVVSRDQEPFALDLLAPFGLGSQLLAAGLSAEPEAAKAAIFMEAERLTRTGELPMAGFGQLAAKQLAEPVLSMVTHHQALCGKWPRLCDPLEISIPLDPERSAVTPLDDWLDRLHQTDSLDAVPRFGRWEFYPKNILDKTGHMLRLYSMVPLWIRHLAGCAQGMDLESVLVAPDGMVRLEPLERPVAGDLLLAIIELFWTGLTRPLPVTAKTGTIYVDTLMAKDEETAKIKASKVYEGDGFLSKGELGYDLYLQRVFPGFDDLWQAQDKSFERLAQTLYAPLVHAVGKEL